MQYSENCVMWTTKLIKLYCTVCDEYSTFEQEVQRTSNNFRPQFTDEECITIYLWGIMQRRFELKAIYCYVKDHLLDWFPKLPSYQAFCRRIGQLAPAFRLLAEKWMDCVSASVVNELTYVVDSCPIVLAKQSRSAYAKVARDLCDKGFNSSKKEYYYGLKLHTFAARHSGTLPTACAMIISEASAGDLTVAKQIMEYCHPFHSGTLYADKAYIDEDWKRTLEQNHSVKILTPRKRMKGEPPRTGDAYSSLISAFRQQIECFFNWIHSVTNIQSASKVRSSNGLLVHVFGRIAAAIYFRYFNS